MPFDLKVPESLKNTQVWFGGVIAQPIDTQSRINPIAPSGKPIKEEACDYIKPSVEMRPYQRIQIYNQQYWWRLLTAMQENFPTVVRMFGYTDFNYELVIPFLQEYPPSTWALDRIGEEFPVWLEENYKKKDKPLVLNAAKLDQAFNTSFVAPHLPQYSPSKMEDKITLQPHLELFEFPFDLCAFRKEFIKESTEHWTDNKFPKIKKNKTYFTALYRNDQNLIAWKEIEKEEYILLQHMRGGYTIEEICTWLDTQGEQLQKKVMANLQVWFQAWSARRWLATMD